MSSTSSQTAPSPPVYELEQSIGYLLRRTLATMTAEVERRMEPLGLTEAQWRPLLRLYLASEGVNVAALARICILDAGAMTRMLDRLESKGLCRRVRSQEDRRVVQLELTPEGRAAAVKVPGVLLDLQEAALEGFSADEVGQLRSLLGRLLANLEVLHPPSSSLQIHHNEPGTP